VKTHGQFVDGNVATAVDELARWWTAATQEARFALLRSTIKGEKEAPQLEVLKLAIIIAEIEAGEIAEG
jgi:hypothetical protein